MALDSNEMARLGVLTDAMMMPDPVKSFHGMFYGVSGVGKSHLTMEVLEKILAPDKAILSIDSSGNWQRIKDNVRLTHPWVHIPFTFIEDIRIFTKAIAEGIEPYNNVGAVVLDEASWMAEEDVDRLYETRKHLIETGQKKRPETGDPDTPDWADYRPALVRFRSMLTELYAIEGLHVILISHEKENPPNKPVYYRANFSDATYKKVKAPLQLVARVTAEIKTRPGGAPEYERSVQVHPTKTVDAKQGLGLNMVKFNAEWLPDAIQQWLDKGAVVVEDDSIADEPDPRNEQIKDLAIEEAIEVVDATTSVENVNEDAADGLSSISPLD